MSLRVLVCALGLIAAMGLHGCSRESGRAGAVRAYPTGADPSRGELVYAHECAACHGAGGAGGQIGPQLKGERARRSYEAVRAIVDDPAPPMPKLYPSRLTQTQVRDVAAYVETL